MGNNTSAKVTASRLQVYLVITQILLFIEVRWIKLLKFWCRSPAEIVGTNPTGGMDVCLLWVVCVVR